MTFIFDLDGTLLDTLTDLMHATNHALRLNGMKERSREEIRCFVGNGVRKLIERAVPEGTGETEFEKVFADFRQYYMLHQLDATAPYPGIIDMLARLKERGCKMAVVSNKLDEATKQLVNHFFGQYISVAIGEREGIRRKPAPDTVFEALRLLHSDGSDAVYVGDSEVDYATACASGLPCISVLWGFRDKAFLESKGATRFVSSPEEVCDNGSITT